MGLKHPIHLATCAVLIMLFGVLSLTAVLTKSATYDEPMHALGGWMHRHEGDFRINIEDPPLWQYWASIPNGSRAIKVDKNSPRWQMMPLDIYQEWGFAADTLYRTPGNDGVGFVNRMRAMMVLLGIALCIVVVVWTWQLAGPTAAVIAAALVCLDPNLIAHSGLVKNDVPMALMMAAVFLACWKVGRKVTLANAAVLCLLVAASVNVKFSAILFGPMLLVLLAIRVLLPGPWIVLNKERTSIAGKFVTAAALVVCMAIVSYIAIWACYGFRFGPSPDPTIQLNTDHLKFEAVRYRYLADNPPPPPLAFDPARMIEIHQKQLDSFAAALTELRAGLPGAGLSPGARAQVQQVIQEGTLAEAESRQLNQQARNPSPTTAPAENVPLMLYANADELVHREILVRIHIHLERVGSEAPDRFIAFFNVLHDNYLLPSAWLHGILFVHARSIVRGSYLLGQIGNTGWWYYFPLAMLFKSATATVIALLGSVVIAARLIWTNRSRWLDFAWPMACLLVPFGIYMITVMSSNLNIGVRHVLCVFPLMYVAAGVIVAKAMTLWPWITKAHVGVLAVLLAIETLTAWPDYIAFFNFPSDRAVGKFKLLADSNFDWGQDLPVLVEWQKRNPNVPLALAYWGLIVPTPSGMPDFTALPSFYGLKFTPLPIGAPNPEILNTHAIAISATYLQGAYNSYYTSYRQYPPKEILPGGTIYIYDRRTP